MKINVHNVTKRFKAFTALAGINLEIKPGELVALLGPSGSGKTTLLRILAGLEWPDEGQVLFDGEDALARSVGERNVGFVFQHYALFRHLTVFENVAFGLRVRPRGQRLPEAQIRQRVEKLLDLVQLRWLADRHPNQLSGGQRQRVALARALARDPRVLLLDEPLAALDISSRGDVRRDLRRHLETFEGMRLMVTHDPIDAYALADRVVVLEAGAVTQHGSLPEVTARPRTRYVAELVGLNLVAGDLRDHALTTEQGGTVVTAHAIGDGPAFVAVRPQAISLHRQHPEGSPRNVWELTVTDIDQQHDRARVRLDGAVQLVAEVTPAAITELDVRSGEVIWASVKATDIEAYAR